ncbi:hypothetical protein OH492_12820 [Vibrio chagasii]|nr:hypothetical protein [Vibrio chagasii]
MRMLEKHEGDPVDIKINGTAFGTGEIVIQEWSVWREITEHHQEAK